MAAIEKYLNVSHETNLQHIKKRGMPAHKPGRKWRFMIAEAGKWLRSGNAAEADNDAELDGESSEQ